MKSYTLSYASGATHEINADNDKAAIRAALALIGPGAVAADQWDADGFNGDDEECKRLLIWADEESSANDFGAKAVAQLETVGRA